MTAVIRLVTTAEADGAAHVSVAARHEAELDDGRRVLLLDDRGWSSTQAWPDADAEDIRETTRTVVGPDEPYGDRTPDDMAADHWAVLAQVLHRHGVDPAGIRDLPHDVELGPALLSRLGSPR